MIDHVYISVSDIDAAVPFYREFLGSLGWTEIGGFPLTGPGTFPEVHGFAFPESGNTLWLRKRSEGETGVFVGLRAGSREGVAQAADAAAAAGATVDLPPSERPHYGPNYFATNVRDADDNIFEVVQNA